MNEEDRKLVFNYRKYPNICSHIWEDNKCIKCSVKRVKENNWFFYFLPNGVRYFSRKIRKGELRS